MGVIVAPGLMDWVAQRFHIVLQTILRSDDTQGFKLLPRRWFVERTSLPGFIVIVA